MIMLRDQIYPVCQRAISDRYPFVKASKNDLPLADFAKLEIRDEIRPKVLKANARRLLGI